MKKILIVKKGMEREISEETCVCFIKAGNIAGAVSAIISEEPDMVVVDPEGFSRNEVTIIDKMTAAPAVKYLFTEDFSKNENCRDRERNDTAVVSEGCTYTDYCCDNPTVVKAIAYIRKNYRSDISVRDVAEALFVSRSYLCTLFKQHFGCTVIEYRDKLRVEEAINELLYSNHKIKYIGQVIGFATASYFCRVFHAMCGLTPRQYREKYKNAGKTAAEFDSIKILRTDHELIDDEKNRRIAQS